MLAIIDYGVGNLFSLISSLRFLGVEADVVGDEAGLRRADRLLLPGVGAFSDAVAKLRATGLDKVLCEETAAGKPLLGVCLGMQMLLERSYEFGEYEGLGLIPGCVRYMDNAVEQGLKLPQIGWNTLKFENGRHPLFRQVEEGEYVYFVHSYHAVDCGSALIATTDYGGPRTAAVASGNVMGTQFHPEKSGEVGLRILKAFCDY